MKQTLIELFNASFGAFSHVMDMLPFEVALALPFVPFFVMLGYAIVSCRRETKRPAESEDWKP